MPPIEYSEYKSLIDILDASSNENAPTYEDLMSKEKNVLSTINHVVNNLKERQNTSFLDKSIDHILEQFFLTFPTIVRELYSVRTIPDLISVVSKEDRSIFIGIALMFLSFLTYLLL